MAVAGFVERLRQQSWSVALSLAVHALLATGVLVLAMRGLEQTEARELAALKAAEAEAALRGEGSVDLEPWPSPTGVTPTPAGGAAIARIDTGQRGRGGDEAEEAARHLADRDDHARITPESTTFHAQDQVQRIRSAKQRSSWEDRRSTTRPMEMSFVVSGDGRDFEKRARADVDPARGATTARPREVDGVSLPRMLDVGEGAATETSGGRASPGEGGRTFRENGPQRSASRPAFARPDVPESKVSIPSNAYDKVRDDVDSRQAVASALEAIVHASYAGGEAGDGRGGTSGAGAPGAGGAAGEGSHPRPLGAGSGDWIDFDTTDPALASYFRRLKAKMNPALARAFPKQAALDLKQGFVIVEMNIARDGAIEPKLLRPSGIEEYDRNCITALRAIAPEPLPKSIAKTSLRVRGRFEAANPVIK